jgi:iron(III) transport system substrate-binding protein
MMTPDTKSPALRKILPWVLCAAIIVTTTVFLFPSGPPTPPREVVVYTSVDQMYSEPVFQEFQNRTGIRVLAVYDVEAAKTTGLVNRLIAEKPAPRADVFWSGEVAQTLLLQDEGVLAPYHSPAAADIPSQYLDPDGFWTGIGGRARVILVNTRHVTPDEYPQSILDMATTAVPGERIGIANPLFGTTATEAAALYARLGPDRAYEYYSQLKNRGIRVVDGNSVVKDLVSEGELSMGLADSDDGCSALAMNAPVTIILPDQQPDGLGTLIIPNTIALIAGGPHSAEGRTLIDYLASRETESELTRSGWIQIPVRPLGGSRGCLNVTGIRGMDVRFTDIAGEQQRMKEELGALFIR